jgi:hypothetical protein
MVSKPKRPNCLVKINIHPVTWVVNQVNTATTSARSNHLRLITATGDLKKLLVATIQLID